MSFGRADLTNVWRRVRQVGAAPVAIAALLFGAVRCADLTAPAAVGNITILYNDPAYPATQLTPPNPLNLQGKRVDYAVGLELSPKFDVMIGSSVQPRARYVYSRASADSGRVAISQNGNAVRVIRPGIDTVIATVVGATIGGPTNGVKLADTILVFSTADSLFVERRNVTFNAFTAADTLSAAALATDNSPIPGIPIQWVSQNSSVVAVTQTGIGEEAILTAVGNGTTVVDVTFAGVTTIPVQVTVQQQFARYFLSPPSTSFASKTATASVTAVAQDARNQPFTGTTPAFQFVSSAPGKVSIDPSTGLMRAVDNTAGTDVQITAQISGVVASNTVTAAVAQDATTIDIQSQDPRTISSIGGTLSLGVIVRDALNQDWTKDDVLWTTSNSGKATATLNGLTTVVTAHDTGQVYVRAKADNAIDSILVIISNDPATVELSPDPFALTSLNQTGTLAAIVKNAAGTTLTSGFTLTWISRDSNVVEPQPTAGQMLARNIGEARIVVTTNNNVSDSLTVRVTNAPDTVRIIPDTLFFSNVGDVNSTFAVDFKNGLGAVLGKSAVAWSTANTNIAQVAVGTGAITAIGSGTTYVLAVSPENALRRDSVYVVVTNNASSMNVTPSTTQTLTALGATLPFSATVFNAAGNPISGAPVAWAVPVGGAFLSIDAVTGVATALANGTATVRASSGGVTRDVTVNVAQAFSSTRSTITPAAASIVANGTSNTTITVQLKDANDNSLTFGGATVVLASSLGTLGLVSDVGNGRYTATLTSSTSMGTASVSGSANAAAISTPGLVSFIAGGAAKYLVTSTSSTPVAGTSVTIRAQLADENNNPVATFGNAVTFTSTNGGSFTGANPASTDGTGVAQITFNTSTTVASHTITAATGGSLSGSSAAITSIAGAPAKYLVTPATATNAAVASGVLISAQLSDVNDNAVALPNQTVNWSLSAANGSFSGSPTATTFTNNSGVASVLYTTSTTAAAVTQVRANFGSAPTGTSATITTVAGASGLITIEQSPTAIPQSGVVFGTQPTIQLRDAQGNPVNQANVTVTAALTSGTGTLTAPPAQTNGSGLATFAGMKIDGPTGPKTITFSVSGVGIANANVTLVAGNASQIAANSTTSQSATVGAGVTPPSVIVRDASNNPVANVSVTFTVTAAATGGAITSPITGGSIDTDAAGVATVGTWTLGTAAGTNNNVVTATVSGLAGSPVTFTASGNAGAATTLVANSATSQSATIGTAVAPPSVIVRDANNNPVAGFNVTFTLTATGGAGGSISPASVATVASNASGIASLSTWTLGQTAGTNNNTVIATGVGPGITFNASGTSNVAQNIIANSATSQSATVGASVAPPSVIVRDASNNPVANVSVTFNVTAAANGGAITSPATGGSILTDASGVATVGTWTLGTAAGTNNNIVTATVAGLTGSPVTFTASGTAGTPTQISINAGNGQSATAGSAVSTPPSVLVRDGNNNPVQGVDVVFGVTSGVGSVNPVTAVTTSSSGIATLTSWTLGTTAGANSIEATVAAFALTGEPLAFTATGTAGAASLANSTITAAAGAITADQTSAITVTLRDANNNPLTASGGTVALSTNIGTLSAVANNSNGTYSATFTATTVGTATISGTLNGAPITDGEAITVTPGAASAATTTITANPTSVAADGAATSTITVQAKDADGNNLTTEADAVTLTATPPGGALTVASGPAGSGTYTATLPGSLTAGNVTITGTINSAGITDNAIVTRTPLGAANYSVTPATLTVEASANVIVTAQLRDANNNPVSQSGKTVNWTKTCNGGACPGGAAGGSFASATSITDANGQAIVALTVSNDASISHTVTATDNTALIGTSAVIDVLATTATISASTNATEAALDNATITVAITNGTYVAPVSLDGSDFTLTGAPAGVTIDAVVTRNSATSATIALNFTGADFDVAQNISVNVLASALATGTAATTGNSVAVAPTAASFVVLTAPTNVAANTVSSAVTLQARETNGTSMTVPVNEVFGLSSNSASTTETFYSDAGGTNAILNATIASGQSTVTFFYRDDTPGTWTLTASDGTDEGFDFADATDDITVDATTATIFASNNTTEATLDNGTLTIRITNGTFAATPVAGDFDLNNEPTGVTIGSVTRNSDTEVVLNLDYTNADFDNSPAVTVNVNATGLATGIAATTGNSAPFTPTAATLLSLVGPATASAGVVSGAFTLEAREANGTSMTVTANTVFDLTEDHGVGIQQFFSDAGGAIVITQATIAIGTASIQFFFSDDTQPATVLVTATWNSGGVTLGPASHSIGIIP